VSVAPALRARIAPALPALRVARFVLAVGLVVAMGVIAVRDVPFGSLTWWLLVPALLAIAAWWLLLARGWSIIAAGRTTRGEMGMWCRTQVLRYLPGGIWAPTSRVALVGGTAVDRLATFAAENVASLCAALVLGGLAMAASGRPAWAALALVLLVPVVGVRLARGRTRLDGTRARRATVNALAAFVCYLGAAVLVQGAVSDLHDPMPVAGAAGISWAVGLVVVITPGGLGARELAYAGLLAPSFRHADLAAAAVVLRALTIAAELAVLLTVGRPAKGAGRPGEEASGGPRVTGGRSERRGTKERARVFTHKVPGS
jgi:glycosyltransferase 2 family protein